MKNHKKNGALSGILTGGDANVRTLERLALARALRGSAAERLAPFTARDVQRALALYAMPRAPAKRPRSRPADARLERTAPAEDARAALARVTLPTTERTAPHARPWLPSEVPLKRAGVPTFRPSRVRDEAAGVEARSTRRAMIRKESARSLRFVRATVRTLADFGIGAKGRFPPRVADLARNVPDGTPFLWRTRAHEVDLTTSRRLYAEHILAPAEAEWEAFRERRNARMESDRQSARPRCPTCGRRAYGYCRRCNA